MPQLVPFYFINEVTFAFARIVLLTFVFSKYVLSRRVSLFIFVLVFYLFRGLISNFLELAGNEAPAYLFFKGNNEDNENNADSHANSTDNGEESSSGGNNSDEDPEEENTSSNDAEDRETTQRDNPHQLENLMDDLDNVKAAKDGDEEAKESLKSEYPEFFNNTSSEEEALNQIEEYLEEEFKNAEELEDKRTWEDDLNEAIEDQIHSRLEPSEGVEEDEASNSPMDRDSPSPLAGNAEDQENENAESKEVPDSSGNRKRKSSDTQLGSNKRQDISDSEEDDNNNDKGGPGGFSGGSGPPAGGREGGGPGPSSSSSEPSAPKTMVQEGEIQSPTTAKPGNVGSPIDFIIELESTTCIYEDFNFWDEML